MGLEHSAVNLSSVDLTVQNSVWFCTVFSKNCRFALSDNLSSESMFSSYVQMCTLPMGKNVLVVPLYDLSSILICVIY